MDKDGEIIIISEATFETEGRLLQELGERLVSSADVALIELIKNAYDADAATCWVSRSNGSITVMDDGHGMTQTEFLQKWMHIATGDKQRGQTSRSFERQMTGAKGIGRFAVRFLGSKLSLESVADDPERHSRTKLIAEFDWESIDKSLQLQQAKIPYRLIQVDQLTPLGTALTILELRDIKIDFGKTLRTQVLSIVSPITGLDRGRFKTNPDRSKDPGFSVQLPGEGNLAEDLNLAEAVLKNYYARIIIEYVEDQLTYTITHKDGRTLINKVFDYPSQITKGLHADIRYFPRRSGMFQGKEVNGHTAWNWIKENCGVGIIDHGFRIKPYGLGEDDWLLLDTDTARNKRDFRSTLIKDYYTAGLPSKGTSKEKANPMLYLPSSHQLFGAVFVESHQIDSSDRPRDLTPATNREGFINNDAYEALFQIVRAGMELLAIVDHSENRRLEEEKARLSAEAVRSDFRSAIDYIRSLPSLTGEDRARLIIDYSKLSSELENVEAYYHEANERMDMMALLGVLAGFLTHEAKRLVSDLDVVVNHLERIAEKDAYVQTALSDIRPTLGEFKGQIEYSMIFIDSIQDKSVIPGAIPVAPQIEFVVERFSKFTNDRSININIDVDPALTGPAVKAAMYSGILMNLYTNALKAVSAGTPNGKRQIVFKAWNEPKWHVVEVADSGIGIPPNLRTRIWDPLFTTTSGGSSNPLGSGMGLGLNLVKEILGRIKGKIELVDPPPGYTTCFKVQFPTVRERVS